MDVREKTVTGMAKYIDREALVEWLKRIPLKDLSDGRGLCRVIFEDDFKRAIKKIPKGIIVDVAPVRHRMFTLGIQQEVDEQPTIDAAPVIRCRECSKWQKKDTTWLCRGFGYCTECMMGCHADNYCSYGYRKEGAE